ncbi:hypothetical protein [Gandjariella thermophila]|uniref:DUF1524 domain-containing protein n=1 Tax=Gandjariella thermophila TaxID=1931992 RepID=A0A4D4J0W0_9PSEU|nr:hypothetical protein [Gandjariella thermophila]GDY28780.1 hypothetical protein GTS_04130 [Gandjariella thermophila]
MRTRTATSGAACLLMVLCAVAGCRTGTLGGSQPPDQNTGASGLPVGNSHTPMPAPDSCRLGNRDGQPLPDPRCTPGAVNPAVSQANIDDTICRSGWTSTVRPATSVTSRMKAQSARSYGLSQSEHGEYDHLVSLELGGAPDDPRNLWVEPGSIPNPKDAVENKLNEAVCSNLIPLATAQRAIAANWVTAFDAAGLRVAGGKVCLRQDPGRCASGRHGDSD